MSYWKKAKPSGLTLLMVGAMILSTAVIAVGVGENPSPTDSTWVKQGMVLDCTGFNYGVQYPFVLNHEGIYKMWYSGIYGSLDGEIYYATSPDGVDWTGHGCVLAKLPGTEYVVAPSVLIEGDGSYKMWFSCHDGSYRSRTYLATSDDGINWINQGLVVDRGPPGSPDSVYVVHAKVFKDGNVYKMYYKAYDDNTISSIMYATSTDGYTWTKHGVVMDLPTGFTKIACPFVVKNANDNYTMWYHGAQGGTKIYIAYSTDGLTWTQGGVDLDVGAPGEPDDAAVYCPYVMNDPASGDEWLYYVGHDGWKARIFLAEREGAGGSPTVDLSIYDVDISVSNGNPAVGESVNIQAVVHGDKSTESEWVKHGVVVDIGGWGQTQRVGGPSVIKLDNGTYVMYYVGNDSPFHNYRIFRAFSFDGLTWNKECMVLDNGGPYSNVGVMTPQVTLDENGTFDMWYSGYNYEGSANRARILHATSNDGYNWQEMGLVINYGTSESPDSVAHPFVLPDGDGLRMWYNGIGWSPLFAQISHAILPSGSPDWIKEGVVLDNQGPYDNPLAQHPWVIETGNGYEMFYSGRDSNYNGKILQATSTDGYSWTKEGITLEPSLTQEGTWLETGCIILDHETYKIWYVGYYDTSRIFYAEKAPANTSLDVICTVSFYLDSIAEGNLIDRQFNIFVPGDGQTTVTTNWIAEIPGGHNIIVDVSDVDPPDSDLSNNVASKSIFVVENPATATATGPQGAHHDPIITLTYEWTESPSAVDLFYSSNSGDSWNYLGTDTTVDGTFDWEPEANPGPKPSKYYWIANAKNGADDVGIPANGTPPEAGPFNWKTWDTCKDAPLPLCEGSSNWFFISVPLDLSGDLATIFDDANWGDGGTTWDYIQWYDAADTSDPWKSYSIYRPASLNDDVTVDNTMGFWIHLTSNDGDGVLTVGEGPDPVSTTILLHAGWNLVGYPTLTEGVTVSDAFWGTGVDGVEVFDISSPYRITAVSPSYVLQPGEGYWVHVAADTTWVVDW